MDEHKPLYSVARSGSGLPKAAPARSRTDPPSQPKERSHLSKRLHSNTITGHLPPISQNRHRHRDRAKETVQSAIDFKPPISFEYLLRRDKKNSPDSSRHGSVGGVNQQQQRETEEWQAQQRVEAERQARRRVKAGDVERARRQNEKIEEELRRSLKEVEELGMKGTRQLDDTYYAILEKASILRSTIASLQQLAKESRRICKQFDDDTRNLEHDTRANIESFGNFEEQEKAIDELVGKLRTSKSETHKLNDRLEAARNRIEAYERREEAIQSKRRKRWHVTWGTLVGVVFLIIALAILKHRRQFVQKIDGFEEAFASINHGGGEAVLSRLRPSPSPSKDPYLNRLFDEL